MTIPKARWLAWSVSVVIMFADPLAFAQLAPTGQHYAGRPSDTGFGGTLANAGESAAASIPFDLPAARGGLPIPLNLTHGASAVGAAGLGWDVRLSYLQQNVTFAHRRPRSAPDVLPSPYERTSISLVNQSAELIRDGNAWVARQGTLELSATESGGEWLAYDGGGRTYTFERSPALTKAGLWLLQSIRAAGGASVELRYAITTWPLDGGSGVAIDLIRIDYNAGPGTSCAKNTIALTYGSASNKPLSLSVIGGQLIVRKHTLTSVEVSSRATCADPLQRLRRYNFQYAPDTDTLLPQLTTVTMTGREGTPEENTTLPIASYIYGSATSNGILAYKSTQTIDLPSGVNLTQISGTTLDPSVTVHGSGEPYAMWQSLTDVTGDGRPDLVFQKNGKLWVAYNQPGASGTTTIGAGTQTMQLADTSFSSGPVSTQTSALRRFAYAPSNRNTTDVWRQAIDVNGDGRVDIVDAAEEADHWVVYLNTPTQSGVGWQRRSFLVSNLRAALISSGHKIDGPYVPLSRRATGTDIQTWQCWRFNGTDWLWYAQGFSNHACQGVSQQVLSRGPERTIVEWDLIDINGDGYPDFVFDSSPVDFQIHPPSKNPKPFSGALRDGMVENQFLPRSTNVIRAALNVVGVRFDANHSAFARSFALFGAQSADRGLSAWECRTIGTVCDESVQTQNIALVDVNGDGVVDRVVGTNTYLGVFGGTAVAFSSVFIKLPGPLASQHNTHKEQCVVGGGLTPTATQLQGLRDLTGDGVPDYFDQGKVWIGTGTGFRDPISITTQGAIFQFSHQTESCDGRISNTDGGLFDIDGDGRPEIVGLSGNTFLISQLNSASGVGAPDAGRLIQIDNGYGGVTKLSYVSAKNFTDSPVPFPETVVSSVRTTGERGLGGTTAELRYAYNNVDLVFDSTIDRFVSSGYRRVVALQLLREPGGTPADKLQGLATISDTWPLTAFTPGMSKQDRWLRVERAGHPQDLLRLRGIVDPDPWQLLSVDANDTRVVGVLHSEWNAKLFELPLDPNENVFNCVEMVDARDYAYSVANNIGANGIDSCRVHGFAFIASQHSWYGASAPPSDNNIQTEMRTLAVDEFGRATGVEFDNDVFRSDDDVCLENAYAMPAGPFPRVLTALASRRLYTCGKSGHDITVASESWAFDGLPTGSVSYGFLTSHSVDRRITDTGAVVKSVRMSDTTYDAAGNPASITTLRDSDVRTTTFSYDAFGLVPTHVHVDATGVASSDLQIEYDPISLAPLSSSLAGGIERRIDFDGFGRPVRSVITPPGGSLGVLSVTAYAGFDGADPNGRHVTTTRFATAVPPGQVANATGRSETLFVDELSRERKIEVTLGTDYANAVIVVGERQYDDYGRITFRADPYSLGQNVATVYGTTYSYSNTGDLSCVIRGTGPQPIVAATDMETERFPTCIRHSYVGHLDTVDVTDAASLLAGSGQAGVVKRTVATAAGRIIERLALHSGIPLERSRFNYDPLGQVTSITRFVDPIQVAGPVEWSFQVDSTGQIVRSTQPDTATRSYTYSDWREPVATEWVDGGVPKQLLRHYDALGRPVSTQERTDGVTDPETIVTYAYDNGVSLSPLVTPTFVSGHLAAVTSASGQISFSYNALGQLEAEVFKAPAGDTYIERAENDAGGRLQSLAFELPDEGFTQELVKYRYDSAGRMRGITYSDASGSLSLYQANQVDALGRVRNALIGGNTTLHAAYASNGRQQLKEMVIESPAGSRRMLLDDFDPVGRETARTEFTNGGAAVRFTFEYDRLGRLAHATKTQGAASLFNWFYRYDSIGNISSLINGVQLTVLNRSVTDPDRVCRIQYGGGGTAGCNVTYDGAGAIVQQATANGVRAVRYFNEGKVREITEGNAQALFRYDAFGRIGELNVNGPGPSDKRQSWRFGELLERQDSSVNGTLTSTLLRRIPGPGGILFASRRGIGQNWVFSFGEMRANRSFTNQSGSFVQDLNYQPFGEANSTGAGVGSSDYTGQQWNGGDTLTPFNLTQLGARTYDPAIGRFLSRDPLVSARSATESHPYAFAHNDPINSTDPDGLCAGGNIGNECEYLDSINPLAMLAKAWDWFSGGGPATPPQKAKPVYAGPVTARGLELQQRALDEVGYIPKDFNLDTMAATGMSMSDMIDRISEVDSPERDAAIDAYNAKIDRWENYSRAAGWSLVAVGSFGVAACEAGSMLLLSRGMLGAAEFVGGSSVSGLLAGGGGGAFAGTQFESELEAADEVITADAVAARGSFQSSSGGIFTAETNKVGGTVWTSQGLINQNDVGTAVNNAMTRGSGPINILTGVHGYADGSTPVEANFYSADVARFGNLPGVTIVNFPATPDAQINGLLNGSGTTIGAFCNSAACLARFW